MTGRPLRWLIGAFLLIGALGVPQVAVADGPVICFGARATIVGTDGADILTGTDGSDVIAGLGGDDQIYGLNGNDLICAGDGNDVVVTLLDDDVVSGGAGDDLLMSGGGSDTLYGEEGADIITGGPGSDTLDGGDGADFLQGGGAPDRLLGGPGNDRLQGDAGADVLLGEDGDDELQGGAGDDRLKGGEGDDYLWGDEGADELVGGGGDDLLQGGPDADSLLGGQGHDELWGAECQVSSPITCQTAPSGRPPAGGVVDPGDLLDGGSRFDSCNGGQLTSCETYRGSRGSGRDKETAEPWRPVITRAFRERAALLADTRPEVADALLGEVEHALQIVACESLGDPYQTTPSGPAPTTVDGLFQHKSTSWEDRAAAAGFPGASVFNPLANSRVAAWMVAHDIAWYLDHPDSNVERPAWTDWHCDEVLVRLGLWE
jgi:hypothetical protein